MANNFLSLLFCYNKNSQYVSFPLFNDLGASSIAYVLLQDKPAADGVLVPTFVIVAQNPKSYQFDTYWVAQDDFVPTLAALQTLLNATSTQNSFTLYTDLEKIQGFEQYTTGQSIVIGDNWTKFRVYNVGDDSTDITVNITSDLIYLIFTVAGDQTTSGNYYYDTYL